MNISFKQLSVSSTAIFSLIILGVLTIQDIQAETVADEMRNKSQQCAAWANTGEVTLDKARFCIFSCRIEEAMLTDENVQNCRKEYSSTKSNVAGIEKPEKVILKPPGTIDEMVVDMNKAKQEYKLAVEKAATSESKMQAQNCHDSCVRNIKSISRQGTSMHRAEAFWLRCTKCGDTEPKQYTYDGSRTLINNEKTMTTMSSMPDVEGIFVALIKGRLRVRADDYKGWSQICRDLVRVEHYSEIARKIKRKDRVRITGITYDPESVGKKGQKFHCKAERVIILGPS